MSSSQRGKDLTFESRVLSSLYNPFTLKNSDPKWPDGLTNTSTGIRQSMTTFLQGSDYIIALIPGLVNWCFAYRWDEANDQIIILANHADTQNNFGIYEKAQGAVPQATNHAGIVAIGENLQETDIANWRREKTPNFTSWRGVSYGCRLRNVNTDHDNDGWFECIRTTRNVFIDRMGLWMKVNNTGADVSPNDYNDTYSENPVQQSTLTYEVLNIPMPLGSILPTKHLAQEWFSARNWALMPSYASGKLNALKDFVFQLNPEKRINELKSVEMLPLYFDTGLQHTQSSELSFTSTPVRFLNYSDYYTYTPATAPNAPFTDWMVVPMSNENQDGNVIPPADGNAQNPPNASAAWWRNFHRNFCSDNFDVILIKVHGLENTKMVLSSVANVECVRNESYTSSYHHSSNAYACLDALDRYLENRTRNHRIPFADVSKQKM